MAFGLAVVCGACGGDDSEAPDWSIDATDEMVLVRYCDGTAEPGANTLHIDATNGDDTNPGTEDAPLQTLPAAAEQMAAGDTLVMAGGIYRLSEDFQFGPRGNGRGGETVFRARQGERVIITSESADPPRITAVGDYVRLERLWFGGARPGSLGDTCDHDFSSAGFPFFLSNGPDPVGHGKALVGCTFFGIDGINIGSEEDVIFQGTRHVLTGRNCYTHGIYLSGGASTETGCTNGSVSNHMIVDSCLFVANEGYGAHGYHVPLAGIVTRNVFAGNFWGFVWDGSDALVANNFFWRQTGFAGQPGSGTQMYGGHQRMIVLNNIFGPTSPLAGEIVNTDRVAHNAFLEVSEAGAAPIMLTAGAEADELGVTPEALDEAVATLRAAFNEPVEQILQNTEIESAFAALVPNLPESSPLVGAGEAWLDVGALDVGPSVPGPACQEGFWDAYRAQGLRDIDRFCQLPDGSSY